MEGCGLIQKHQLKEYVLQVKLYMELEIFSEFSYEVDE